MPARDAIHKIVKQALTKDAWIIKDTDDLYVISYGERFLFVDLGASKSAAKSIEGSLIGAKKNNNRIAIEIIYCRNEFTSSDRNFRKNLAETYG